MNEDESAILEQKETLGCGSYFPLLWLLIPQILAFVFCGSAWWASSFSFQRFFVAGVLFLAVSAAASVCEHLFSGTPKSRIASGVWRICFPVAAFFLFCTWWGLRAAPVEDWIGKSPREVEIKLRVEKSFLSADKRAYGFARIENISGALNAPLAGTRIWYSFSQSAFDGDEIELREGSRVHAAGVLNGLDPEYFNNQDFLSFLHRERVSAVLNRAVFIDGASDSVGFFTPFLGNAKKSLREKIVKISSGGADYRSRAGGILGAMLLGDRALLSDEQKKNFLLTGTMHIFAVSGLHISILAGGLLIAMRFVRFSYIFSWLIMLGALWIYVQIIGAPPSAMRAWMMLFFIFLGCVFGRGRKAFHGLLFSAFVALIINPQILENVGFQLSYLVVAAILLYGSPAANRLDRATNFNRWIPESALSFPRKIAARAKQVFVGSACISFSAFLAGTPIVISLFGFCSFLALLANIVLVPVVAVSAWLGVGALLFAYVPVVGTFLGEWLFSLAAIPLTIIDSGTELLARVPVVAELSFPWRGLGTVGGVVLLLLFFFGATHPWFRQRPWFRFALPPLFLCLYLLIFAY